jgi:hypothetical protein
LVEPADMPAVVRIVWPSAPTVTTPAKLSEVAAEAMKILAYASTRYAQIRLNGNADLLDGGLWKLITLA